MAPETLGQNEQYDKKVDIWSLALALTLPLNPDPDQSTNLKPEPEQVDIWSLGITCIELAQMKPPLTDKTSAYQVMMCIVSGPPPVLAEETNASPLFRDFVKMTLVTPTPTPNPKPKPKPQTQTQPQPQP